MPSPGGQGPEESTTPARPCKTPARCGAVRCGAVRCGAVRCGAVRCGAVRCGAVRCGVVRCSTAGSVGVAGWVAGFMGGGPSRPDASKWSCLSALALVSARELACAHVKNSPIRAWTYAMVTTAMARSGGGRCSSRPCYWLCPCLLWHPARAGATAPE
jgi:hypothetical protein